VVTQKCRSVTGIKRISSGEQPSACASPSTHPTAHPCPVHRAIGDCPCGLWKKALAFFADPCSPFHCLLWQRGGRQGVRDPVSASYEGCLAGLGMQGQGKSHSISEVAFPSGGRGCLDVGCGLWHAHTFLCRSDGPGSTAETSLHGCAYPPA